jgi:hypothetical protein
MGFSHELHELHECTGGRQSDPTNYRKAGPVSPTKIVGVYPQVRHSKKQVFLKYFTHLNKTEHKNVFFDPSKRSISCGLPMGPLRGSYGIRK